MGDLNKSWMISFKIRMSCSLGYIDSSPWAKPFRGDIRPESSPPCFLGSQDHKFKEKFGGHLSAVAFGSEKPLSENIYFLKRFRCNV